MDKFVNLHVHTAQGSLLDGLTKTNELFDKTIKLEQPAVAITDHGTLFAVVDAAKYAQKQKYKYIPGFEAYHVTDATIKSSVEKSNENDISRNHLLLLAKNNDGYKRLMKICSWGHINGFYYRPRIDDNVLEKYGTDGIIAGSACFLPGTDILTHTGIKDITEINDKDKVFTHHGHWKQVISPTSRNYKGTFYKINVQGNNEINCTADHQFFILPKNSDKPQWVQAKDIHIRDYSLTAINDHISTPQFIDIKWCSYNVVDSVRIDQKLLELVGMYLSIGEVNIEDHTLKFHLDTTDIHVDVDDLMNNVFNHTLKSERVINKTGITYIYKSEELARLFAAWTTVNGCHSILPMIQYLPPKLQLHFIKGLFVYDGKNITLYRRQNNKCTRIMFSTNFKWLFYYVLNILNRNGINPRVKTQNQYLIYIHHSVSDTLTQFIENDTEFTVRPIGRNKIYTWNNIKYFAYPIKDILSYEDEQRVYCLNVEDDHSFTAHNVLVHNCIAGIIPQKLLHDDYEGAKEKAEYYAKLFKDGFYLEIQPVFGDEGRQVKVNKGLIELSKETGIPLVATTDAHYLDKEDSVVHDILLCTQSKTLLSDPKRWKFPCDNFYIMSRSEIIDYFQHNGHETLDQHAIEEAIDNTVEIANQCDVSFTFGKHYLPKINPPSKEENPELMQQYETFETRRILEVAKRENISVEEATNRLDPSAEYLRFLCIHGWHGIMNQLNLDARHLSLLFYELDVIISMGFPSYFLIMYDIMEFCHQQSIAVGPARGCIHGNAKVDTLDGYKTIETIAKGDMVISIDEKPHIVIDTLEYDCDENILTITTEDDRKITGITKDHKVLAIKQEDYNKGLSPQWIAIGELDINDYLCEIENQDERQI